MTIPLLLIHAFPLSGAMWRAQVGALGSAMRVITPDLPGFGKSPRQARPSIPAMASELGRLLDELQVKEPAVVCGLSMGGYVAFEFLRQFPQRVRALGLFSTRAVPDAPEVREARFKTAARILSEGLEPFSKTILLKLIGHSTLESAPAVAEEVTRLILANRKEGVADALLAMADRRDSTDLLETIRCPTLIVAGEEDSFIPVSEARSMQDRIPGARLAVIPRAGHLVSMEQPQAFAAALEKFLGGAVS